MSAYVLTRKGQTLETPSVTPRMAAGIWHALLQYATRSLPAQGWAAPAGTSQAG